MEITTLVSRISWRKDEWLVFISLLSFNREFKPLMHLFWQLNPPPEHPLYLVSIRGIHLYLRELSDVQDLGLNDPSGNGIIPVLSESMHYRKSGAYITTGTWQIGGDEAWLDYQT
jgi:hypothetical protein